VTTSAAFTSAKREIVGLLREESIEAQRQEGVTTEGLATEGGAP
jgi:hypothetical protein